MNIRSMILAPVLVLLLVLPVRAEIIPIADISAFLNNLETAQGRFTQINPDGTISTGSVYIKRPGRMRFDYDAPDPALVIAGGGAVAIFDRKSNEPPQQFPLKRTPLSVILKRDVDLGTANMITDHRADALTTTVTAQDPDNPDIGFIDLVFTAEPVELRQWVITDQDGSQTTVILGDMEFGVDVKDSLFSVLLEIQNSQVDR
ncbi:MAG: outer membrane lipoprotein-sorting protein [Paracoccaceae bacterium]|jgi:outer membrane lipoprotein-sorting protein